MHSIDYYLQFGTSHVNLRYTFIYLCLIRRLSFSFFNSVFQLELFSSPESNLFKNMTLISMEVWRRNKCLMKK